ncbi:hypothetical protein L6164_019246 [Bauhinia variegata]|uniref:Uncharacterized protein n=1 Tax=Bauhinia variegata TaxID=167791 RepID=A0ACB9NDL2_BAUVA|nr:hypothetical protein L6164_019246 [Bauhinia variegata]
MEMGESGMSSPPIPSGGIMHGNGNGIRHKMMMHMSFYWGNKAEILFRQWPGDQTAMYVLALLFVFVVSILVEWLSHSRLIRSSKYYSNNFTAGLIQSLLHLLRVGLAYVVMLALMSFNVGVFLAAIAGHALGFFFFASRAFNNDAASDLPPITC